MTQIALAVGSTMSLKYEYESAGFVLLKSVIPLQAFDELEGRVLALANQIARTEFRSLHTKEFASHFSRHRAEEEALYRQVRDYPWIEKMVSTPQILESVSQLLGPTFGLFRKIPLRIDLPLVTRELAIWHQDFHYVGGNTKIVTAWIPLQDTDYPLGPLMVMPQSHLKGPIEHSRELLGKKQIPEGIFRNEIRYVEMKKGDLLLFDACLLHSSSLNISELTRFSLQPRFTPLNLPVNPAMGGVIDLNLEHCNENP